jgi:hypothetical protein
MGLFLNDDAKAIKDLILPEQEKGAQRAILSKGQYPPERYSELIDFHKKVAVYDNMKISLKKAQI